MHALILTDDGPRFTTDYPEPALTGEARIRLSLGGICATDLELVSGYMGFTGVLGHEWVGVVEEASEPDLVGRRVVGEINCPCRICATCLAGRPTHCPHRTVLGIAGRNGAFAERFSLPVDNLFVVPDAVPDEAAVFVEPLAAALQILVQAHIKPTQRVVVLGLGRLGQLCARVLALSGAEVTGVSRTEAKRSLLPSGIATAHPDDVAPGADVVVDCTGSAAGMALAARLVRPGGRVVLKTTVHDPLPVSPTMWVIDEVTVIGSRCGPFGPALRLLETGAVDPRPLITGRASLEDGVDALTEAARPGSIKVLLEP
ncbi:MAG: alcohol dehydrogenase catalytic domain-containing protein [Myxococcota bacterium]|nr:alcohol dehydrogenase catalytic domain-containing protein [Myxococcota bacterium]